MKIIHAALALLTAAVVRAETAAPVFPPERFRAHVEFLADDLLEGRDTGSRGYEIAARYVATQMEAYGLQPGGEDGTWFQRVTFQKTIRGKDAGAITISGPAGEQRFAHADNVLIGLQPREPNLDLSAPLVFVGYGIEDARFGLNDYRGLDVKGCIVVQLRGFPKGLPSEEGAHLNASKGKFAEKHGAIGALVVNTLQSEKAFPWQKSLQYANDPDYAWVQPDGQAFEESPGVRTHALLHGPAAEALFAGARRQLADILREADREKASPRGFRLKTRVNVRTTATWERVTSPNVIGILPGADKALSKQYAVLSAHLDHLGVKPVAGDEQEDRIYNGALDNAAGVATLLEVARAAAAAPDKPRRSMIFLATTGEEKGLLGADYYARHPTVPISQIVGNVDLDMPLLLYPFSDVIAFGANHSSIGPMVARAVAPMNIKLAPDPFPEQGVFTRSDHYRFVRQGVPAVFLATGMANGGEKHWREFLAGAYHSTHDDLAQQIDWQAASRFAEVNYRITRAMTDSDTPPLWFQGDYFGDTFAPHAARTRRSP
ncbi:MAG TPA: M28 family metallopeptidase [Steroidobacteraceae bacterium]|nr:M28 family metallopeptidase [Steroidobacteraceae bacterium]